MRIIKIKFYALSEKATLENNCYDAANWQIYKILSRGPRNRIGVGLPELYILLIFWKIIVWSQWRTRGVIGVMPPGSDQQQKKILKTILDT